MLHPLPPFAFQTLQHFSSACSSLPVRASSCSIDKSIACSAQDNRFPFSAKHDSLLDLSHIHVPPAFLGEPNFSAEHDFVSQSNEILLSSNLIPITSTNSEKIVLVEIRDKT